MDNNDHSKLHIRSFKTSDLEGAVILHLSTFEGFFLSFLGKKFLIELYAGILEDPSGIALLVEKKGTIQGIVAGTDNPQEFYKRIFHQRWFRFALAAAGPAFKNPSSIPRLLRAFSRGKQDDVHEKCATLMSIAVIPNAQGTGIGKMLVKAFLEEALRRGVSQVNLTTDRENNDFANHFYQNLGFSMVNHFITPEGREMNEYLIDLTTPA